MAKAKRIVPKNIPEDVRKYLQDMRDDMEVLMKRKGAEVEVKSITVVDGELRNFDGYSGLIPLNGVEEWLTDKTTSGIKVRFITGKTTKRTIQVLLVKG